MKVICITEDNFKEFSDVINSARHIIHRGIYRHGFFELCDSNLDDIKTVYIKPIRLNYGFKYKKIGPKLLAELKLIPSEAVHVYLRQLAGLPNE